MDLDTSRLRVRELTPADLNAVHAVHHPGVAMNDNIRAELGRWLEWTVLGYEQYRRLYQPPYGEYGIVLKGTGELVGLVGLVPSLMPFALVPSYAVGPGQPSGSAGHPYSLAEVGLFWAVADVHRRNGYAAEAGAALVGTEVKSIMEGRIQLKDSYVTIKENEVWLYNAHISPYSHGNIQNHEPLRPRKMLLHRKEIEKLEKEIMQKGMTLVVTSIYWKNGRIKFEIGVAKGKKLYDKRETEMRKTIEKETRQQLKEKLR